MIIVIVSEFAQIDYFQWHKVWSIDRQKEKNVLVKDVIIDSFAIKTYSKDRGYWMWLKQADLVFVYCSRLGSIGGNSSEEEVANWSWWQLPILAKQFMKPEAKMISQWDDDWIWLFHPKGNWFSDQPDNRTPEQFFRETEILDVSDENWTVLNNPEWAKYSHKPVRYMPLPHLWRYNLEIAEADGLLSKKGMIGMHGCNIALLTHTSVSVSVEHTVKNVAEKLGIPVINFLTSRSNSISSNKIKIENIARSNEEIYMKKLRESCFVGIDDAENYIGWSRFVMECLMSYVPCIGSTHAVKLFNPELYIAHKDYARQIELINELLKNHEFYERVVLDGRSRMFQHLNTDKLCDEMIRIAREDLKVINSDVDVGIELFMAILDKMLPWYTIPRRPKKNCIVYDNYHNCSINGEDWDKLWGPYEKFISDERVLRKIEREVLDRKRNK